MDAIARGNTDYREISGSPEIHVTASKVTITRHYEGLWSFIQSTGLVLPSIIGVPMVDLDSLFFISDVKCKKKEGDWGEVTIEVENQNNPGWTTPIYDCEWVALEKDLILNPRYAAGGDMELTLEDSIAIGRWRNNPSPDTGEFDYYYYSALPDEWMVDTLTVAAADCAGKIAAGTSAYKIWYPVISAESYSLTLPTPWKGGVPENPPDAAHAPAGYQYQRSGCRRRYERHRYSLRKEWIGAEAIDTDLYPTS